MFVSYEKLFLEKSTGVESTGDLLEYDIPNFAKENWNTITKQHLAFYGIHHQHKSSSILLINLKQTVNL